MSLIEQLGIALGLASLAGINLYLTTLIAGCAIRFHWVELSGIYSHMSALGHPAVIGVAAVFYLIEFFADKIPWVDSMWDVIHTGIRPAGAILLSLAVLGNMEPSVLVVASLLAGTAALSTHSTKAGVRALLNLSPEPVTNSVASVAEDGLVLGGLGVLGFFPAVALGLFTAVVIACTAAGFWIWRRIFRLRRRKTERLTA